MTQQDWIDSINEDPANLKLRLVYSDWLEEQGRLDEAKGWRETLDKLPGKHSSMSKPYWWCLESYPMLKDISEFRQSWLPKRVFLKLTGNVFDIDIAYEKYWKTYADSFFALAALVKAYLANPKGDGL